MLCLLFKNAHLSLLSLLLFLFFLFQDGSTLDPEIQGLLLHGSRCKQGERERKDAKQKKNAVEWLCLKPL